MTDEYKNDMQKIEALEKKMLKKDISIEDFTSSCHDICDLMKQNNRNFREGLSSIDFVLRKTTMDDKKDIVLEIFEETFPDKQDSLQLLKARMKAPIKWQTQVESLPEDKSYDAVCRRLENGEYNSDTAFLWDCSNLTEHVINDTRKFDYTKNLFDKLLSNKNTTDKTKDTIIYGLGEISSYCPELKDEIVELFAKHPNEIDNYFERCNCLYHDELVEINNASKELIKKRESNQEYLASVKEKAGITSTNKEQNKPQENEKSTPSIPTEALKNIKNNDIDM